MGLDIYLRWKGQTKVEKEKQYTGFKNAGQYGYLRSSYNEGGFDSWARKYINKMDFYYIFGQEGHDDFKPNWDACLERAEKALTLAEKVINEPEIITIDIRDFGMAKDEADALKIYHAKADNRPAVLDNTCDWFGSGGADYFLSNPPKVKACIPMKRSWGTTCMLLICEPSADSHKYYIELLKNDVMDFIKLGKEKNARIVWSG